MSRPDDDTERRLVDLEVKAAFGEDLLDRLNEVIVRQQDQIDGLRQRLARLEQQGSTAEPAGFRSLRDELPPHY